MNITIKSKIFYPIHGAGWVKKARTIEVGGQKRKYLEFEFINSGLTVSTPLENIDKLGIRKINSVKTIEKAIKSLRKKKAKKPPTTDYNSFINLTKELANSGELENFVLIICYSQSIKKQRNKDGRLIPTGVINNIRRTIDFIISELAVAKNISYEDAQKEFEKLAQLKIDDLLH